MNLDLVTQKRAEAQSLVSGGGNKYMWKPAEGEQTIRIVPYIHNMDWPFVPVYKHFNISSKPFTSPITFGKHDPIKEYGDKLFAAAGGDKKLYEVGKMCKPKLMHYVPILVRGQENEGVKFWSLGIENYNKILDYINEPSYGDITDPERGRDIKITYKKSTAPGTFSTTTILVMPDRSPITNDRSVLDQFSKMPDVRSLLDEVSEETLNMILLQFTKNGGKVVSMDSQPQPQPQPQQSNGFQPFTNTAGTPPLPTNDDSSNFVKNSFEAYFKK